jgi:hypothetical protein
VSFGGVSSKDRVVLTEVSIASSHAKQTGLLNAAMAKV